MTKLELIKILQSLPGNPEIVGNHPTVELCWYDESLKHSNRTTGKIGNLVWGEGKK